MNKSFLQGSSVVAACLAVFACFDAPKGLNLSLTHATSAIVEKSINLARVSPAAAYMSDQVASGDDYLPSVCQQGTYKWPASRLPIKIYISSGHDVAGYHPEYKSMIRDAFTQWCDASGDKLSWKEVSNRSGADITVDWTTQAKQISTGTEAGETNALTRLNSATGQGIIYGARMHFLTELNGEGFSDQEVQRTCLHEAGHALGLQGHSPDRSDVMYYAIAKDAPAELSDRDRETMAHLYSSEPATDSIALGNQ